MFEATSDTKSVPIKDIVMTVQQCKETNKDFTGTMYNDGVWSINIEWYKSGVVKFWVSREDKRGNYNSTLVTVYRYNNELNYTSDFKLKDSVIKKILSTYRALEAASFVVN